VAGLRRQLLVGRDTAMEEIQLRNKFLSEKLEQLEQASASQRPPGILQVTRGLVVLILCCVNGRKKISGSGNGCGDFVHST